MPLARKLVKVFLASPGDLADERRTAKVVVDEFNADWADTFGYLVELVGWEDTVSGTGRPQAIINRELAQCELFVGMMWRRWGTPPDHGGLYTSGFEEEYRTSFARWKAEKKPEISLLFKEIGDEFLKDPGDDLKKVLAFREEVIAEKTILFEKFVDLREFERKFRRVINKYVKALREEEAAEASSNRAPPPDASTSLSASSSPLTGDTPLSREGASFLRDFVLRTEQLAQPSEVDAAEIARFRLLATVVKNDGNDEVALGVHDANLLYSQRKKFMFGARERSGLLNAALEHYDNENVPLWHWLASLGGFDKHILPFYSLLAGSDKRRQNAIAAMRIIGESVPDDSPGRKQFVMFWLSDATPDPVRVKALEYLGERGTTADLPPIREELKRGNSQTSGLAANAIVRITLRDSREAAVRALFELQPSIVDGRLVHELFENHSVLSTELLQVGLDQVFRPTESGSDLPQKSQLIGVR